MKFELGHLFIHVFILFHLIHLLTKFLKIISVQLSPLVVKIVKITLFSPFPLANSRPPPSKTEPAYRLSFSFRAPLKGIYFINL